MVKDDAMAFYVVAGIGLLCFSAYVLSKPITPDHEHDLHTFMDVSELQYHFGQSKLADIPNYDVITPEYLDAYRDFPSHIRDPNWIYPLQLEFYLDAFDTKHKVQAIRNDYLFDPDLSVTYYKTDKTSGQTFKPSASQLQRFYLTRVVPADGAFDIPDSETNGALAFSRDGMRGLFETSDSVLRIVPLRETFRSKYNQMFDIHEDKTEEDAGTHIIYKLSKKESSDDVKDELFDFPRRNFNQGPRRDSNRNRNQNNQNYNNQNHNGQNRNNQNPNSQNRNNQNFNNKNHNSQNHNQDRNNQNHNNQNHNNQNSKSQRKGYSGLRASLKLAVIADHTVFQTMVDWQFLKPENQLFFVLAFYNEVQAMYRERVLRRYVRLHITLKWVGFFQSPHNDLGADQLAEMYLKNVCEGPYNSEDYDHVQALTYLDIYDKNSKRKKREELEQEFDHITLPEPKHKNGAGQGWRPKISDPQAIPETHKAYDTIGLAWIGSTCNQRRHCSLVEMNSPMASLSGAHELGHSLGMHHEEQLKECHYNPKDPDRSSFMSSHSSGSNPWATKGTLPALTRCTTDELIKALNGANRCLIKPKKDKIERQFSFKTHFLGTIIHNPIEASNLCELLMGPVWMNFKKIQRNQIQKIYVPPTETGDEMCMSLDCKVIGVDSPTRQFGIKFGPALAGTICSPNKEKICYNFKCVDKDAIGTPS